MVVVVALLVVVVCDKQCGGTMTDDGGSEG